MKRVLIVAAFIWVSPNALATCEINEGKFNIISGEYKCVSPGCGASYTVGAVQAGNQAAQISQQVTAPVYVFQNGKKITITAITNLKTADGSIGFQEVVASGILNGKLINLTFPDNSTSVGSVLNNCEELLIPTNGLIGYYVNNSSGPPSLFPLSEINLIKVK